MDAFINKQRADKNKEIEIFLTLRDLKVVMQGLQTAGRCAVEEKQELVWIKFCHEKCEAGIAKRATSAH